MTTFTLDADNHISAFAKVPAGTNPAQSFTTEKQLAKLTAGWPASRLVDTWNHFAGVVPFDDLRPVKKFTNRKAGVARIWKAVQRLTPAVAPTSAQEAPRKASADTPAKAKRRATGRDSANEARPGSKKAEVLDLLRRPSGATLPEIMETTGWQAHTVRGFVSGTLRKMGLPVASRREDGVRTYSVNA